jgi:hypothetical protein
VTSLFTSARDFAAKAASIILLLASPAQAEAPRAGYMFQGVFDSTNEPTCATNKFYCVNGKFPLKEAIRRICSIPRPTYSVGWKTFGNDLQNFHALVGGTLACNADTVIRVSFEHGPARPPRAWRGYWTFSRGLSANDFNRKVARNKAFQRRFVKYLQVIKRETVDTYPQARFIFFAIEDNFSCEAFTSIRRLYRFAFGSSAELMRNKGFLGESCDTDSQLRREVHGVMSAATISRLRRGDIYCPDGAFHAVPGDSRAATNPRSGRPAVAGFDTAKEVADLMRRKGVWFEQWYPEIQAITREDHSQRDAPHQMNTHQRFVPWVFDRQIFKIHQGN